MSRQGVEVYRPVILLIENDEADVFMFRRALAKHDFHGTVRVVSTVSEARRYLTSCGEFADRNYYPCPDLIVSDMNLRGSLATDLLEWARQQPESAAVPFVFLSGSFQPPDKARALLLGANAFYVKSGNIEQTAEHIAAMLKMLPRK